MGDEDLVSSKCIQKLATGFSFHHIYIAKSRINPIEVRLREIARANGQPRNFIDVVVGRTTNDALIDDCTHPEKM